MTVESRIEKKYPNTNQRLGQVQFRMNRFL